MSWSKVQICNMALGQAGHSRSIGSLTVAEGETTPPEVSACLEYWDLAYEGAARSHNWACLTKREDISAAVTTAPAWGYAYAYSLPADYLGWLRFEDSDAKYKKAGRLVHTDESSVTIEYVARTEDTDLFDPLFVECLVMRLAAFLAATLQGENSDRKVESLRLWHERVTLPAARFADSSESRDDQSWQSTEWIDSRL